MKIHLATTIAGIFALDEEGNIINTKLFEQKPQTVAKAFVIIDQSEIPKELNEIINEHKEDEFIVQDLKMGQLLSSQKVSLNITYFNPVISNFYKNITTTLINLGLFKTVKDYQMFLRSVILIITKDRVRKAADKRDRLVVHAIETIDDLDKTLNLFSNRLREFYGMHFPELVDAIENHFTFARIVSDTGNKEKITKKQLVDEINLPEQKAETLLLARERTMGSTLLEQDIQIIQEQAQIVVELFKRRQTLEKWMEDTMKTIAPNSCGVISPLLGARLISLAGSLKDLALSPSSKIQVLGAEKALYRTIKTGAPPPKHGVIFQDPRLNQAKWWLRGKIARVLSGRISIAARMDYFEAENKSSLLAKEVEEKINEIIVKYPEPPKGPKKDQKQSHTSSMKRPSPKKKRADYRRNKK